MRRLGMASDKESRRLLLAVLLLLPWHQAPCVPLWVWMDAPSWYLT